MKYFCRQFLLLILIYFTGSPFLNAQQVLFNDSVAPIATSISKICSNDILLYQLRKNPDYVRREKEMNEAILKMSRNSTDTIIMLPVVVHIINQNPFSISDADVINGIADLNNAFSKTGAYSASLGADTRIQFCLSKKDPDGGNTSGITRTNSFFGDDLNMDTEDSQLKNLIQWDPQRYINIWLITNIHGEAYADFRCGTWYRLGVGGYATLPPGGGATDGIVVTGFGKVLAHEMGHYLGLYHTFQGGCLNNNCATDGDRVCDTPPDSEVRPSPSCASPDNTCRTDTLSNYSEGNFPVDVPDQISNFMDYGNGACSNQFTQGQADRMRAAINTQRTGLLEDECTAPCSENILASFTIDIAHPLPGDLVTFTNTSTGTTNNEWLVDGVLINTTTDFSYTFPNIGEYQVLLKSFNNPGCFATSSVKVIVNCGVTARFFPNKKTIASTIGIYTDSIVFTNTSQNGVTYEWLISNDQGMPQQVVSTNVNLTYVFPSPANYTVILVATSGNCSDTSAGFTVPVLDPTADGAPINMSIQCFNPNTIKVSFCLANFGIAPLPVNTPINFYDDNPALATANRLSPTMFLPSAVPGGNCFVCFTHLLNVNFRNVERVYMVFNDNGTSIPVVLPNATLPEKSYFNNTRGTAASRSFVNATICQGQSFGGYNATGIYVDTVFSVVNGCAVIRTLNLTVLPTYNTVVNISLCQGQSYGGHNSSGTFVDVFSAVNGCDSTRTLNLVVKPVSASIVNASICQGQNYAGHTTSGTYVDVYTAANGCDSTRTLNLVVKPVSASIVNASICQGQNYAGHTTSGTYIDVYVSANGCDSTRTLNLTVKPVRTSIINMQLCQGQSYAGYTVSGTYVDVFIAANGCDSTRTLNLLIKQPVFTIVNLSICQGQIYAGYSTSGTYVDVFPGSNGCDSTRTLNLIVKPVSTSSITTSICEGTAYAGHTVSGTYIDVYTAANGCDSTRTLFLTVHPRKYTNVPIGICRGERYFAQGQWQTETGTYYDTARTSFGCDSITITQLTVHPLPTPELGPQLNLCVGESVTLNPGTYTTYEWQNGDVNPTFITAFPGTYFVTVSTIFGCKASDTVKVVRVLATPKIFLPEDSTLCIGSALTLTVSGYNEYLWNTGERSNSIVVTRPDIYILKVRNAFGCYGIDSIKVDFETCVLIQIPNAFTPDNDGKNDVFKPLISIAVTNYTMQIFNRSGKLLFETHDYLKGWNGMYNGTSQPAAAYVYLITFIDNQGIFVKKYGSVILIR